MVLTTLISFIKERGEIIHIYINLKNELNGILWITSVLGKIVSYFLLVKFNDDKFPDII